MEINSTEFTILENKVNNMEKSSQLLFEKISNVENIMNNLNLFQIKLKI